MKIEELRIGQRVRINDGQDWNDDCTGEIYSLSRRKGKSEDIGVLLDTGLMFDGFTSEHIHAPYPETPPND